ncbi:uncharacterized protein LOC110178333 [Drosophila serrata]|uniref:uncharacterized protein LOC110178333 n=1 Tax=Drosophila serrata TaxID=7274 RepID=UPI000A1D089A|nr:uncharacterized protein LOC110178333 [Drosophila serrata]KAH8363724.1 hypothetical protein KR200_011992 [Drosophila serrata]
MIYSDNCCCCIGLKCGCILIAIIEVLIRGLDRFFVDRDSVMGFFSLIVSGIYVISCICLFFGALLGLRCFLMPYLSVSCLRFFILVVEGVFVATEGIVNNYLVFDVIQSVLGLYFWLVVFSYYDRLKDE